MRTDRRPPWLRAPWPRSVRARAAAGAGLAAVVVLLAAFWVVRDTVRRTWMAEAVGEADRDAAALAAAAGLGVDATGVDASYVLVRADGRWLQWTGQFAGYGDPRVAPFVDLPPVHPGAPVQWATTRTVTFPDLPPDYPAGAGWSSVAGRTLPVRVTASGPVPAGRVAALTGGTERMPAGPAGQQRVTVHVLVGPEKADAAVAAVDRSFAVAAPAAVLLVAAVAWLAAAVALRPVAAIRARLARISVQALDQRVPVPASGDEITRLAEAINSTLDRLEGAVQRQQRFVADASHELRSPLANLRSGLEVPLTHPAGVDWPAVAAGTLGDVERLQRLTDDLLVLAVAGRPAGPAVTDLGGIVAEQVAERAYTGRGQVAVTAQVPGPALVHGTETQLGRVVRNLLDNAVRYARTAVTATVEVAGEVVLTVADDGPGIPAADRERVFERFVRLDDARSRADGGAGLGLTIVRELVGALGGSVHVAAGPGAAVVVRLPTAGPASDLGRGRSGE